MSIKWQEPPVRRQGGGRPAKHSAFFAALRKRPGKWAVFLEDVWPAVATQVKDGRYSGTEPGEFDAVHRTENGTRRGTVYVRYIGEATS